MGKRAAVLDQLAEHAPTEAEYAYLDSEDIAAEIPFNKRVVGAILSELTENDDVPVDVMHWSNSGKCATWRIACEDVDELRRYSSNENS